MKVRDFIKEHIECNLSMMTPCGFIDLTAEMSRRFMEGGTISTHPGCSECHMNTTRAREFRLRKELSSKKKLITFLAPKEFLIKIRLI